MKYNYAEGLNTLFDIFISDFFKEYNTLRYKNKKKLLAHIQSFFRRWLYSSFVEGTIITPSVIFQKLSESEGVLTMPSLKFEKNPSAESINSVINKYSLDDHPAVDDLKIFLNTCVPFVELKEDDTLSVSSIDLIEKLVSIQDEYYLDFLLNVSIRLKLIKKMPSIYSNKAQVTAKASTFFVKNNKRVVFEKIVGAAIDIAQINIGEIMPPHVNIFSKDYLLSLLKHPIPTDIIFKKVYSSLGLNMDAFFEDFDDNDELDMFDETNPLGGFGSIMLSSTYLLGVLLDKYFLTPFGQYLKLISPFYFMPYQFGDEMRLLHDEMKTEGDINSTLWSPPSSYFLTSLGLSFFNQTATSDNFLTIPDEIPLGELIRALKANALSDNKLRIIPKETEAKPLYEIKAKVINNKKIWFNIEIENDSTLHQLHAELCDILFLDYEDDYSIFLDETESPFMQYVSPLSKKNMKKADLTTLSSLELKENQKLIYVMPRADSPFVTARRAIGAMRVELEVLRIKEGNPRAFYPFTSKKSKALAELEGKFNGDLPF